MTLLIAIAIALRQDVPRYMVGESAPSPPPEHTIIDQLQQPSVMFSLFCIAMIILIKIWGSMEEEPSQ